MLTLLSHFELTLYLPHATCGKYDVIHKTGSINHIATLNVLSVFVYPQYSSVTNMLVERGLPSFNTVIHNSKVGFANRMSGCDNAVVRCVLSFTL